MVEALISKLAEGGLVAVLLGITLIALGKLWLELKAAWLERIAEQKTLSAAMDATSKSNMTIAMSMDGRNMVIEALGKAQEATARDVAVISRDLDRHISAMERRDQTERERWERVERLLMQGRAQQP